MKATSDWFTVSADVTKELLLDIPGATRTKVHRTHKPLLPTSVLADLQPRYEREMPIWPATVPLRSYQQDAAHFCAMREGSLLACEMGLGKTRVALCATYAPRTIGVVVAPLVAFSVWRKEIALVYGPDYPVTEVRGRKLTVDDDLTAPGIYLLNPEIALARWTEWMSARPEFCILDEAHLYIRSRTQRHQGAQCLAGISRHRVALTGTPILRHLVDLHGILQCLAPTAFGGWKAFALDLGMRSGRYGIVLADVPDQARRRLDGRLSEIMFQCRWREVADVVPDLTRERFDVKLDKKSAQEYNRLAEDVRLVLGSRVSFANLRAAAGLLSVMALRRFIGMAKVEAVADLVCSTGEPVVVWTWHRDVAHAIAAAVTKRTGEHVWALTGACPQVSRGEIIREFQEGRERVLVATIAVAGVGIDLTAARITVIAEPSWTPAENAQAESRVWRSGQLRACVTYWPVVAGTVEERVLEVLYEKDVFANTGVLPIRAEADSSIIDLLDSVVGCREG